MKIETQSLTQSPDVLFEGEVLFTILRTDDWWRLDTEIEPYCRFRSRSKDALTSEAIRQYRVEHGLPLSDLEKGPGHFHQEIQHGI